MKGTVVQWAARHGISRIAAYKRIRAHGIPLAGGKIDFEVADAMWMQSMNPAKRRGGEAGGENGKQQGGLFGDDEPAAAGGRSVGEMSQLGKVQLLQGQLRVKRDKLQLDILEGKFVPLDAVRNFEAATIARAKNALLSIGSELRDDLAAETEPAACQAMVDRRIEAALTMLAAWKAGK